MDRHRSKLSGALAALALLCYFWLCTSWFDHELDVFLRGTPPAVPASLLAGILAALGWRWRSSAAPDGIARRRRRVALCVFLVAVASRTPFLFGAYGLFSSDAATQGVMALHILEGRHHPIYLYNWSYVGSLKAHLTALLSWLTGEPVVSFAATAVGIYAAYCAVVYLLARRVLDETGALLAAGYVVIAPGFLTAWGMGNEGNYLDVLLLGTLALLLGARMLEAPDSLLSRHRALAFWMGVCCGVAFWTHIIATYYLLTALGIALVAPALSTRAALTRLPPLFAGFVVGDFPGLLWNASHDWLSFRWWSLDAAAVTLGERWSRTAQQLQGVLTDSFAVLAGWWPRQDPPWPSAVWYVVLGLVIPATAAVFAIAHRAEIARAVTLRGRVGIATTLLGFALLVVLVFAQSSFGWMTEEPRYLLFLFSVVPVFLASALTALGRRSKAAMVLVVAALAFVNARGNVLYLGDALRSDSVNRDFVRDLDELGITHAHSDYHLSYKYTFLTHGRTVWSSALGPAQTEWYEPFREEVAARPAAEVALVPRSFRFARRLGRRLDALGIGYRREDRLYPILLDFTRPYALEDLR